MKTLLKKLPSLALCLFALCVLLSVSFQNENIAYAEASNPTIPGLPPVVTGATKLPVVEPGKTSVEKFDFLVRKVFIPNVKNLFVVVSIIVIMFYVFKFIIATGTDDIDPQKKNLLFAGIGFGIIGISLKIVEAIAPGGTTVTENSVVEEVGNVPATESAVQIILVYIQYFAGGVALLFMFIAAVRIVTSQGIEEEVEKQKKNFTWGALGLMVIMLARVGVEVIYQVNTETKDIQPGDIGGQGIAELMGVITYILQYVGLLAVGSLVLAGVYYLISLGDEEKTKRAKTIIKYTILAIVIIYTSYSVVAYIARDNPF